MREDKAKSYCGPWVCINHWRDERKCYEQVALSGSRCQRCYIEEDGSQDEDYEDRLAACEALENLVRYLKSADWGYLNWGLVLEYCEVQTGVLDAAFMILCPSRVEDSIALQEGLRTARDRHQKVHSL